MSNKRYTDEFRAEAVKQVLERGFTVVDVAARIGIPKHTLYDLSLIHISEPTRPY